MEAFRNAIPSIHKEGYIFILIFAVVSLLLGMFVAPLGWIGAVLTAWCVYFFRDPTRVTPIGDEWVVSPADGVVQKIERAPLPIEMGRDASETRLRISIFLNVFNVHVNRVPAVGKITFLHYFPGKFFNASLDKASLDNERQTVAMETADGRELVFVQIAGLVARRIVCDLTDNQVVKAGERFGIIRFGSRMDVYLPEGVIPKVVPGQTVIGGETILANLSEQGKELVGEVR